MIYDDNLKKWVPSGTSSGLSKVHIYQHMTNVTFRVVGRKLQDHEVPKSRPYWPWTMDIRWLIFVVTIVGPL